MQISLAGALFGVAEAGSSKKLIQKSQANKKFNFNLFTFMKL